MQAPAQLQATIELLDEISDTGYPADRTMANYFRQRRYIGSKDKAVISEQFYSLLRNKLSFSYLLDQVKLDDDSRLLAAVLLKSQGLVVADYFCGQGHAPSKLSDSQHKSLQAIDFNMLDKAPLHVKLNVPEWIAAELQQDLGDHFEGEMLATNQQATTDIRVNTLKSTRKQVSHFLAKSDLHPVETELSPWGLRFDRRVALFGMDAFKQGWFEIQDEGSQLLALIADAQPGDKVVDFCAGAGGKTLAMAATMNNKGTIYACDVHSKRLQQLTIRAKRAGAHNIRTHVLSSENDKWVKKRRQLADVVLIDAPCSGTGTWRRSPDSRWNLTSDGLQNLVNLQASILKSASRLVRPGGKLIYATCSLLSQENEQQVQNFLNENNAFEASSDDVSKFNFDPALVSVDGHTVRTSPAKTGTDGFFAAVLRAKEEEGED